MVKKVRAGCHEIINLKVKCSSSERPCLFNRIHSTPSATKLKINGAEQKNQLESLIGHLHLAAKLGLARSDLIDLLY